jgi:hypothetical protein
LSNFSEGKKMNIENLIQSHNDALQKKVDENIYLNQRIKARLKEGSPSNLPLIPRLTRSALIYASLFLIFTLLNILFIGQIKKEKPSNMHPHPPIHTPTQTIQMSAFSADFPGSISGAYAKVIKWQNP